jgi:glycosyltransferase involved in cell wall biosynthesis
MKVLFVSNDPTVFDATSATRKRMCVYAALLDELHIVSPAGKGARVERDGNLFLHPLHSWKLFRVPSLISLSRALILEHGIEVVSAQDPFEHGFAALRAIRGTKAMLHIQVHTDFLSPWFVESDTLNIPNIRMSLLNGCRRIIANRVLPAAGNIRAVSNRVKTSLMARYGSLIPEPLVIPVAVDDVVPAPARLPPHAFTFALIVVGRLEPEKRIEDILIALKIVTIKYPMIGLFIVGDGSERRRLGKIVRSLGLTDKVIFLGERPDARALMGDAQAFIQASAYEGYGRTLIEAALAKLPIITTDVGIVGEVFKNYEDVLATPVVDPVALSISIVGLVEDNAVRQKIRINAEIRARAHLASGGDLPSRICADIARTLERS